MKYKKPKIVDDWDSNRKVVTNQIGEKFVLFNDEAERVFNASMKVYKKKTKR
jgi:hypothetical protein